MGPGAVADEVRAESQADHGGNGPVGPPLDVRRPGGIGAARETIIVGREAAIEAEPVVHREARDERRRVVTGVPERLGDRSRRWAEHEAGIVADAVDRAA